MVDLDSANVTQIFDRTFGVNVFHKADQLLFPEFIDVLNDTLHFLKVLEFVCAIIEEKLSYLKIVVWDFFVENFRKLLLNSLNLCEVLIVEPAWDLYLAFIALFQIDCQPKRHGHWLSWAERPKGPTHETKDILSEVGNNLYQLIFCEKLVLSRSIVLVIHLYILPPNFE